MGYHGFLLIDKEAGFTSRDVDSIVQKTFNLKRVGHLGTLDPFATGLLIVAVGQATKALELVEDDTKVYQATLKLGESTDTQDLTGNVIETKAVPELALDDMEAVLASFVGKQTQMPPEYSAKHIDGRRAYDLARQGMKVELEPIRIDVKSMRLIGYDSVHQEILFETAVSKGTYIRTLGQDIAKALGMVGHLVALRRIRIGNISVRKAKHVKDITTDDIKPIEAVVTQIPQYHMTEMETALVLDGVPLALPGHDEPELFMMAKGKLIALYKKDVTKYYSDKGFRL